MWIWGLQTTGTASPLCPGAALSCLVTSSTWQAPRVFLVGSSGYCPFWGRPGGPRDASRDVCFLTGTRKRISLSCERLRALLPQFDGRREDMASVLEMSVQFLRLASALGPSQEQHAVSCQGSCHQSSGITVMGHLTTLQAARPLSCPSPSAPSASTTRAGHVFGGAFPDSFKSYLL